MRLHNIECLIVEQVSDMGDIVIVGLIVSPQVIPPIATLLGPGVETPTKDTKEAVEASLERVVHHLGIAQVPLAHQIVPVPLLPQLVSQGGVLRQKTARVARDECDAEANIGSVPSRHQSSSRRSTGRVDIVVVKLQRALRQRVNVGGHEGAVRIGEPNI